jgi:hypothetical protein
MSNLSVKHSRSFSLAKLLTVSSFFREKIYVAVSEDWAKLGKPFLVWLLGTELQNHRFRGKIFGNSPLIAINLRQAHRFFVHLFLGHEQRVNRTRLT